MTTAEYELKYLEASIEQFESYLLSDEIYWPLHITPASGKPPYPEFTLGWMLLYLKKASALAVSNSERMQLDQIQRQIEQFRSQWQVAWEKKAIREFQSRLFLWRDFIELYRENPADNFDRYRYEVSRRVILALLADEVQEIQPSQKELLEKLDKILKELLIPGKFLWDFSIQKEFPMSKYWYLYGELPKNP